MKFTVLVMLLLMQYTETLHTVKRQGIFGLCQGWGAGCALHYHSPVAAEPRKEISQPILKSKPDFSFRPHSFFFTSGESWNPIGKRAATYTDIPFLRNPLFSHPSIQKLARHWNHIGKRTAWYTDIPFLRNPLLKYPSVQKLPDTGLSWRYPLAYRSRLIQYKPTMSIEE